LDAYVKTFYTDSAYKLDSMFILVSLTEF
jgi:hypothetical protein